MKIYNCSSFRILLGVIFFWLICGPITVFAQLGNDTPNRIGPFLGGKLPKQNPNGAAGAWGVVPAFPKIKLSPTLAIAANPNNGDLWVGSLAGLIQSFAPNPATSKVQNILDLQNVTSREGGLIGIAFHPDFGKPKSKFGKYFYVYYASLCALNKQFTKVDMKKCTKLPPLNKRRGFYGAYLRLSRFEYSKGDSPQKVKNSETPMFNLRLFNNTHRGGGPVFGKDGYMYLAIGEQEIPDTAQDNRTNLHGGLRLAVDVTAKGKNDWNCPAGSHKPKRTFQKNYNSVKNPDLPGHKDELSGNFYCIPNDNPWLDPTGTKRFEEYFSVGHRNPHRITMDRKTGQFWSGEIGSNKREEVNIIAKGNNYGWPCREGFIKNTKIGNKSYCKAGNMLGKLTNPVIDFTRDEAEALIGGYVYRGSKFPELYGKYLAGDWPLGHIYAITYNAGTKKATKKRLTTWNIKQLSTWGEDLDGEIYLGRVNATGPLHTLSKVNDQSPEPPAKLSGTGAFSNLIALKPASYWLPYDLNQPFWSDGAEKHRWIAIPAGKKIKFSEKGNWSFPKGTVIMKHFELPIDENNAGKTTRLETRFMVHGNDQWYGVTYRWNKAQTNADLLTGSQSATYTIKTAGGGTRKQKWDFPSRTDCLRCHNDAVAGVAGIRTHMINGAVTYPKSDITRNQLLAWNQLKLFTPALKPGNIGGYLRSVHIGDKTAKLADRARSWLDVNCSNCHRPGGPGSRSPLDLRLTTPLAKQNLIKGPVLETLGLPNESLLTPGCSACSVVYQRVKALNEIAMPPVAKHRVDIPATATLKNWIDSMGIDPPPPSDKDACGRPNYDRSTDRAVFVWQACNTDKSWHIRVSGGTGPRFTVLGELVTDKKFTNVSKFSFESNDILKNKAGQIDLTMHIGNKSQDGIDFKVASGDTCATFNLPSGVDVFVGKDREAVNSSFDIQTLGKCN